MTRFELTVAALLALIPLAAVAQKKAPAGPKSAADILPFSPVEKTLENGLKVIVVATGFPNIVSLQIPVQTGSRNEVEPGKSGFAHFFEHMMFRGTKAYPADQYKEILKKVGARQNAYTTDDFTNYHTTFSKDDLDLMLKVEADRFMNLEYTEAAFRTEAQAVLGEYNKNASEPLRKLTEVQRDKAFTTHTYKHTTMGFLRDIEDMPNQFAYSKTFFDRWYRPEHATVIVAGDVEPAKVVALVQKHWGGWKRGKHKAAIPQEPAPRGAVYAHVPWPAPTQPYLTVAFHGAGFSETAKDQVALDMLFDLHFGPTSTLYKRLVEQEQKVDQLSAYVPFNEDPALATVVARVRKTADAVYVRDAILRTLAEARSVPVSAQRLTDGKANARYGFVRSLDNTESIASMLARFVRYRRSYDTVNKVHRLYAALTPDDLIAAAQRHVADERMVLTTLAKDPLPAGIDRLPPFSSWLPGGASADAAGAGADLRVVMQKTTHPQIAMKLLFAAGSSHDPPGKEGLAALSASMVANAGSRAMRLDEIKQAFFPMAAGLDAQVDKDMTTFTGTVHRDNLDRWAGIALPMLLTPGLRDEDFRRVKEQQLAALELDLRSNNEEELGKERLQSRLFTGSRYAHPVLGSAAGIGSITLDDVRKFLSTTYSRANLTIGLAGAVPDPFVARLRTELAALPAGPAPAPAAIAATRPRGIEVEIVEKETRSSAISFGHPLEITRSHPDFPALWLARAWLGEHRASISHLYQRIREVRGMNYGDYAYIEAFPRAGSRFFPDPNVARRAQIFEVWIRPVMPANAHMALRIAIHELDKLVERGLTQEAFETTRDYLMKNVFVMTATQNQQIGYALDSQHHGMGEFTAVMRERLGKLTLAEVNAAIRKHLSAKDLSVVIITKDAKGLRERLLADQPSPVTYDAEKPAELLEEDKVIGARRLGLRPDAVRITPIKDVFAK